MSVDKDLLCKVCGLKQASLPWGADNKTPSFEICACCGVEFGYEDSTLIAIKKYREEWINNGAKWFKPKETPLLWSLENQLMMIPKEYQ